MQFNDFAMIVLEVLAATTTSTVRESYDHEDDDVTLRLSKITLV